MQGVHLEDHVNFAYDSGDFSFSTCQELLNEGFETTLKGGDGSRKIVEGAKNNVVLGQYVYGGMSGVTKAVVNHTALTRYLNSFVRTHNPATWRALSIFKGGAVKVRHDYNNEVGTRNYFASFGQEEGGELWVHDRDINEEDVAMDGDGTIQWRRTGAKEWLPGRLMDSQEKFVEFDPHVKRHVMATNGDAWHLVAYTHRAERTMSVPIRRSSSRTAASLAPRAKSGMLTAEVLDPPRSSGTTSRTPSASSAFSLPPWWRRLTPSSARQCKAR